MNRQAAAVVTRDLNSVRTIVIHQPAKLNALSGETALALREALEQAGADPAVRVVVLTGEGRAFCSGADLSGLTGAVSAPGLVQEHVERFFNPLVLTLRHLNKPVIAAVHGVAAGAGASLALACDLRLCSESASFVQIFSSVALVPDCGSAYFLPRLVGLGRAFELMAFADRLGAAESLRLGVCQAVFPDDTFAAEVQAYAERLAARPAHALSLTKQLLNAASEQTLEGTLGLEARWQQVASEHWEHAEGLRAFGQKRPPRYLQRPL